MDWKEALLAHSKEMGIEPATDNNIDKSSTAESEKEFNPAKHPALHVVVERKGHGGKTATIIEGFICDESQLKKIAATLKSKLGAGGSARGGEILIQGDRLHPVRNLLTDMGFKLKGFTSQK